LSFCIGGLGDTVGVHHENIVGTHLQDVTAGPDRTQGWRLEPGTPI
jgi:hypothetical protein